MDPRGFILDLFGRGAPGDPLDLRRPVTAISATLRERGASAEGMSVAGCDFPIFALCAALTASGRADHAMVVRDEAGHWLVFVESIHNAVAVGRAEPQGKEFE